MFRARKGDIVPKTTPEEVIKSMGWKATKQGSFWFIPPAKSTPDSSFILCMENGIGFGDTIEDAVNDTISRQVMRVQ